MDPTVYLTSNGIFSSFAMQLICVQSLLKRVYFTGLQPLLIKTLVSHPKDLVLLFNVLPQASLVSSVSPLPQLSRPTSTQCRIFLATLGILKQQ